MNEVISQIEVFDDLFEQILSGGLLDSSGGIGVGVSKGEVEIPTDPNVTVVVIHCLHFESGEEIKEALAGGEVTGRAITIEGCSEQGLVVEAKLGGDEL